MDNASLIALLMQKFDEIKNNSKTMMDEMKDKMGSKKLQKIAIPIHTTPKDLDPILENTVACPSYDELYADFENSTEYKNINTDLAELFQNLSVLTGYNVSDLEVTSLAGLFSTITIYRGYNLALPSWTEEYWHVIKYWAAKKCQLHTNTTELARLRIGPFFNYILDYLETIESNISLSSEHVDRPRHQHLKSTESVTQKFLMLSAHDTTVGDVTNSMGVFMNAVPEFGSTVIWELKSGQNGTYVNMYFKNSTDFTELILPECDFNCPYDDYVSLLQPIALTVEEWAEECNS